MKRAILAATALLSSSILSSPGYAAVTGVTAPSPDPVGLDAANLAAAGLVCDAAAVTADLDGPDELSDHYAGAVNEGTATLKSGPTEVGTESSRTLTSDKTPGVGSTYTPAHRDILGDPYRNGGSVNMFGLQESVGGYYSSSQYDFEASFTTTFTHPYTCDISKQVYHAAVHIEGDHHDAVHHDQVGHWIVRPDFRGNEEAATNNCNAFNLSLPGGPHNANSDTDQANCQYIVDTAAYDEPAYDDPDTDIAAYWDDAVAVGNVAGGSFDQTQTDTLDGHESSGAGYFDAATVLIGQVVVCISPTTGTTKKPGAWVLKNGYTGTKCTTAWYSGTTPYSLSNYAGTNIPNLNDGSHNWVTVPVN
jgi:hypothetical protein